MNSKTAFRNTFKLMNSERPVFIPFVYGFAAKLGQIPLMEMVSDASYYTHLLEDAHGLFNYDGIATAFDTTIEAEALGCELEWPDDYTAPKVACCGQIAPGEVNPEESGRIQILLETTKRIVMSKGRDTAIIGVLSGPCYLAKTITGSKNENVETAISIAGGFLTKMVKSLCDLRVDAIFFREDGISTGYRDELLSHSKQYTDTYKTLFNLVKYYNCFTALIIKNTEPDFITELHKMIQPDGLVLLGTKVSDNEMARLQDLSSSIKISFGLSLPVANQDELLNQFNIINPYLKNHRPNGFFYVSEGEIPHDTPPEILHDLMAKLQNA